MYNIYAIVKDAHNIYSVTSFKFAAFHDHSGRTVHFLNPPWLFLCTAVAHFYSWALVPVRSYNTLHLHPCLVTFLVHSMKTFSPSPLTHTFSPSPLTHIFSPTPVTHTFSPSPLTHTRHSHILTHTRHSHILTLTSHSHILTHTRHSHILTHTPHSHILTLTSHSHILTLTPHSHTSPLTLTSSLYATLTAHCLFTSRPHLQL